jgi:hypothetical protein
MRWGREVGADRAFAMRPHGRTTSCGLVWGYSPVLYAVLSGYSRVLCAVLSGTLGVPTLRNAAVAFRGTQGHTLRRDRGCATAAD